MKRTLSVLLTLSAIGVLVHARPASACGAQQKTTTQAEEKVKPQQQLSTVEQQQQAARLAKAKAAAQAGPGAQAKNDAGATRAQPK